MLTVGVTGTNGKTTTTWWIAEALGFLGGPVGRASTLGFHLDGVLVTREMSYAAFERAMAELRARGGARAALEVTSESLAAGFARAWPCDVAVFTNLTRDHLDAHRSPEHYLASKAQLFVHARREAVLNAADPTFELLREVTRVPVRSYAVPSRGEIRGDPEIVGEQVDLGWSGTRISCSGEGPRELRVRAIGEIFAENALAALLGAKAAGVPLEEAAARISRAPAPPGRFEVIHERPYVVVDYAHTPDALARTIATARALAEARVTVVFGAGGERDRDKRPLMGRAARAADAVILTSDNPRGEDPSAIADAIARGLDGHASVTRELDRARAIELAVTSAGVRDIVILAGKGHETTQALGREERALSDAEVARDALQKSR